MKLLSKSILLLGLLFPIGSFASAAAPVAVHPAGIGTAEDPFQIDSLPNLYWLSQDSTVWGGVIANGTTYPGYFFVQTSDIDASATSGWSGAFLQLETSSGNSKASTTVASM